MCGIAGVLYSKPMLNEADFSELLNRMGNSLVHRGPDDSGVWVDVNIGVGFSHRRLSILDLSSAGKQPMMSQDERYIIAFNGEIYNFREIRHLLENKGVSFVSSSDTEVLLESISNQGLEKTLELVNGMFAFSLWDRNESSLTLVRDRVGKKPLYYGYCNGVFLFGSELKAIKQHPSFNDEIDRSALGQYIQYTSLSGPSSIYKHINKLEPGSYIKVFKNNSGEVAGPVYYWSLKEVASHGQENQFSITYENAVGELDRILTGSVCRRMIADVELGAFLSGGIDSSLIVSIMQANTSDKIKTFSIGFKEQAYNEAVYAKKISDYLGTEHTELYVSPKECMSVIPKLPDIFDEPFGDVSQIPTYLVSNLASRSVKVVLSGDGGDELFAGYTRYFKCLEFWEKYKYIPSNYRQLVASILDKMADLMWSFSTKEKCNYVNKKTLASKLIKRSRRLDSKDLLESFVQIMTRYRKIDQLVYGANDQKSNYVNKNRWVNFSDPILGMMYLDFITYLPDDILVKVDRATMAVGLEARAPLLDLNVINFAWALPYKMRHDSTGGKKILKGLLGRYLPTELTNRKKMGFGVPIGDWLNGALKDWANDLLDLNKIQQQGYLNPSVVEKIWQQHQCGWRDHSDILWAILMYQSWLEKK